MKNLTGALVFSLSLLCFTGCHKRCGSTPEQTAPSAPSTPSSDTQPSQPGTGTTEGAQKPSTGTTEGAQKPSTGGTEGSGSQDVAPTGGRGGGTRSGLGTRTNTEACVDQWLKAHNLDKYGNAQGSVYAGGTPLFNEATGESIDRLDYIFKKHSEIRDACANAGAGGMGR
jgi:hypothetical protein